VAASLTWPWSARSRLRGRGARRRKDRREGRGLPRAGEEGVGTSRLLWVEQGRLSERGVRVATPWVETQGDADRQGANDSGRGDSRSSGWSNGAGSGGIVQRGALQGGAQGGVRPLSPALRHRSRGEYPRHLLGPGHRRSPLGRRGELGCSRGSLGSYRLATLGEGRPRLAGARLGTRGLSVGDGDYRDIP